METSSKVVLAILFLGATQGLFLTFLLLTKPFNKTPNRILALLVVAYSAFLIEQSLSGSDFARQNPHILGLAAGVVFLTGPLHYLYAVGLITPRFALCRRHLLHFVPFVLFYLYFLFPFYLKSGPEKLAFMASIAEHGLTPALMVSSWGVLAQGLIYMILTVRLLQRHARSIRDTFSSVEEINLNWLKVITLLTLAIWILGVLIEFLQVFGLNEAVQPTVPISLALLIYVMGYLGQRQPQIFAAPPEPELAPAPAPEAAPEAAPAGRAKGARKYQRSGLTPERARALHDKLVRLMETEKPFTDSSLKLDRLAKMAATSPNHVSQVLNEERQQNFYDFVNGYRIEEARRMILEPAGEQRTLMSIAYAVGFNSKSAFNTAFKKHTGTTPSQLRKNQA